MLKAIRNLFGSKKFVTAMVGTIVAMAAHFGLQLDPEIVAALIGLFAILIHAQGQTDAGKEAARIEHRPYEKGCTRLELPILVVVLATLAGACSWLASSARTTGRTIVDCTTEKARSMTREFGSTIDLLMVRGTDPETGKIDWDPILSTARSFAVDAGMCVLANVVASHLRPPTDGVMSSSVEMNREDLLLGFSRVRAEVAVDHVYKTEAGDL